MLRGLVALALFERPSWSVRYMRVGGLYYAHKTVTLLLRRCPVPPQRTVLSHFWFWILRLDKFGGDKWKRSKLGFQGLKINRRVNCSLLSKTFPTPIKDDVIYLWGGGKMLLMFGLDGWLRIVRLGGWSEFFNSSARVALQYCAALYSTQLGWCDTTGNLVGVKFIGLLHYFMAA